MKKVVCWLLTAILLLSVAVTAMSSEHEDVTITFSYWRNGSNPQNEIMRSIVENFEELYPWIHVELDSTSQTEIANQLTIQSMGGDTFDIIIMPFQQISKFVKMGVVEPLTPYLDRNPDYDNSFFDFLIDMCTYDGVVYALPQDIAMNVLLYNKKLFRQVGLDTPPTSYDEFLTDANLLTTDDVAGFGLALQNSTGNQARLMSMYWASGTELITDSGEVKMDSELGVKVLKRIMEMINAHVTTPAPLELSYSVMLNMFTNEQLAMCQGNIGTIISALSTNPDLEIGVAGLQWEDYGYSVETAAGFMTSFCQHKEEAWQFMEYLFSPEIIAKWCIPLNYIPSREDVGNLPEVKANEYIQAYLSLIDQATPIPRLVDNDAIFTIVYDKLALMVNSSKTPEETAADAAVAIRKLLAE